MATMYEIILRLDNGEVVVMASRPNRAQANVLVQSLNQRWPAKYVILESVEDDKVDLKLRQKLKHLLH
jgi:hypothetical protein